MLSTSFKWYCYSVVIFYRKITIIIIMIERIIIKNDNEEIKVKRSWEAGIETQVVIYWLKQNPITKTWLMVGKLSNFTLPPHSPHSPPSLPLPLSLSLSSSLFLVPLSLADSCRTTWAAISKKKTPGSTKVNMTMPQMQRLVNERMIKVPTTVSLFHLLLLLLLLLLFLINFFLILLPLLLWML